MATSSYRDTLAIAVSRISANAQSIWDWLAGKLDLSQSCPQAAPGVIVSELTGREGIYYILKNPTAGTYFRLSDKDYFLWRQMDGSRTVKEMVVSYFMEYKVLAFGRVGVLIEGLKSKFLLTEQPVNVYREVRAQLDRRNLQSRLAGLGKAFLEKQFPVRGVDGAVTTLYKRGGRLFYTWPAQFLMLLATITGLICFSAIMTGSRYGVVTIGDSYLLGVLSLVLCYLFSIFIHETAHALTVKHYGREVPQAGVMIYFGLPAFFVDTSDIWMEGKRPRLAVTWAGPYADLFLAGLAGLTMTLWPGFFLNPLLFQFAFVTYLSVLFNLNPLLELDGYFLLMDGLEIPMLRRKSLEFIRSGAWAKLKALRTAEGRLRDWFGEFSREERIFAVFGLLTAVWTAYAVVQSLDFWQSRVASAASALFIRSGSIGRIVLLAGAGLLGLVLTVGIGFILLGLIRRVLSAASRAGLFATPWRKAAWVLALVLVVGVVSLLHPSLVPFIGLGALILAVYFACRNALDYSGSRFAPVFWLMSATCLALWLGEAGRLFPDRLSAWSWLLDAATWMTGLASVFLLSAGLVLFSGTDIRLLRLAEKTALLLGLTASVVWMVQIAAAQSAVNVGWDKVVLAVLGIFPLTTMVLLLPTVAAFRRTSTGPAAGTIGLGLAALLGTAVFGIPFLWADLFLAAGFGLQQMAYRRRVSLYGGKAEVGLEQSDRDRLKQAFSWMAGGLNEQLLESAGKQQADILRRQFNDYAQSAGWHVAVDHDRVEDTMPATSSLRRLGDTYATALNLLLNLMARHMGEKMTVRALQRVYDNLPWEAREIGSQYLFPEVKRAEALGRQFQTTQQSYRSLLQRVSIFGTLTVDEIDRLCSRLETGRFTPGQTIIRQGERGDRFYIITRGSVEVEQHNAQGVSEIVGQLSRGDYFGQVALLNDEPRNATCRAILPTKVLSLSRIDFDLLVKVCFDLRGKVESSIVRLNLFRQIPLFADMDGRQLQLIISQLHEESCDPDTLIIRQGEIGRTFYVVKSGRVQVVVATEGGERVVNELGTGEYFGEMALLLETPRSATVRAVDPTHLLTLDKTDFDRLVVPQLCTGRLLEQEMSRRMIQLRRTGRNQPIIQPHPHGGDS